MDDEEYQVTVKKVGFKKKTVKGKNIRSSTIVDEDDSKIDDNIRIDFSDSRDRRGFKNAAQPRKKDFRQFVDNEELPQDPEDAPLIENIDGLTGVDSFIEGLQVINEPLQAVEPKYVPIPDPAEPKYVPIQSNVEFTHLSKKQMLDSYSNEYVDEYNNKDDEIYQRENSLTKEDHDMEILHEDLMAEDEPLEIGTTATFQIDEEKYDMEILTDEEVDTDQEITKVQTILTVEEQIEELKKLIDLIAITKAKNEETVVECELKLEDIKKQRENVLRELE